MRTTNGKVILGPLTQQFLNLIMKKMPSRYKRRFFIGTLVPRVSNLTTKDTQALEKLNAAIVKGKDYKFLKMSMTVSDLIWSDIDNEIVTVDGVQMSLADAKRKGIDFYVEAVKTFVGNQIPTFLRYGSKSLMLHDIESTIREANGYKSA